MKIETQTIDKIDELKKELDSLPPLVPEDEKRLRKKFRLEFNYNSNHIEGNTLTYGQTELLLFFHKSSGDVPVSDLEEMKAHDAALTYVTEMASDAERPLTEQFIKELNKMILVQPYWKEAITEEGLPTQKKIEIGSYKTTPNSVRLRSGEIHEYASPEETPAKMNELIRWYENNKKEMHPVQLAALFHYYFVAIHPFDDGNGRVARLLMNYILLENGFPLVIIKSGDKENYLTALQKADTGNKTAIVEYVEKQLLWSLDINLKAAKGKDIEEIDDLDKELEILRREKLTKSKIYRSPKVAYNLVNHIHNDLWGPLEKKLNKFDDFFAESKTEIYVDQLKVEKKKTVSHPLRHFADQEITGKDHEIFGHDFDEENINTIHWQRKMLSLKSASEKIDYFINCAISLKEAHYALEIYASSNPYHAGKTVLTHQEREYNSYLMEEERENLIKLVSNFLIEEIKQ